MENELYVPRNYALVFAQRTRANLEYLETAFKAGEHVHMVTQLVNSLLGLVVFLWEKNFVAHLYELKLDDLAKQGWPRVEVTLGECQSLGNLAHHLRNAVAHGRIKFSSDSRELSEVTIDIEDCKPHQSSPYWSARMTAADLREFCLKFMALRDDTSG
jgi:hypothetical protein